ncbi:MAG TPA: AMP-binding protein [Symbiobacteriaceae bacterium]
MSAQPTEQTVLFEQADGIAVITFNRPQVRNAFTVAMWRRLHQLVKQVRTSGTARVLILQGAGEQAFTSGSDIRELAAMDVPEFERNLQVIEEAIGAVEELPIPTIACLNGHAVGGGLELALACDLRVASREALLGMPVAKLGVPITDRFARRLVDLVGPSRAKDLIYTGRLISADEAQQLGLVNRVCPPEQVRAVATEMARVIANHSPVALRVAKEAIGRSLARSGAEREGEGTRIDPADLMEGIRAFLEKRPPRFGARAPGRGEPVPAGLPLFHRAEAHADRTAIIDQEGRYRYRDLLNASARVASVLLAGRSDLEEERVAFLVPPSFTYVAVQWGIWRAGGIAVPLAVSHPPAELAYVIRDADASVVVAHPSLADRVRPLAEEAGIRFLLTTDLLETAAPPPALPALTSNRRAMIIYTSGTTSRPKGVVMTHGNIQAQVTTLVEAWEWSETDHILLTLPLHHVHGIINVLTCALWSGALCTMFERFDPVKVWEAIATGTLTLFMGVPTMYARLIATWEAAPPEKRRIWSTAARSLRLMVSGSAPLPVRVLERWREITGHVLLERYGMTEIGMALSNPLHGTRHPGHVGLPLPGIEVRLVDEQGNPVPPGQPGEIEVRGPSVFLEYWRRPEATRAAFRDGWFRTGDIAVLEDGSYRLLGRSSVDIIKSGGYKLSALEIEEAFREHPQIEECAVVGLPDEEWGERVAMAVVPKAGWHPTLEELRRWGAERLAPYKLPTRLLVLDELPRNAMGKVTKPEVFRLFREAASRPSVP